MKKPTIYGLVAFSVLMQSCSSTLTGPITQTATAASSATSTSVPTSTSTVAPTLLPTLPATPTLTIPQDLEECFSAGDPPASYGCVVTTFAGGDDFLNFGDGGPAIQAQLYSPEDVIVSDDGYLYICDTLHNRIRVVNPEGIIDTYVGVGPYYGGVADGLQADQTGLRRPSGLALGNDGLLYFVDAKLYNVRKVTQNGIVRTVAGDNGYTALSQKEPFGDGGSALGAWIDQPSAIAFDLDGNLYIADTDHNRIRRVEKNGIITTLPIPGLNKPQAIAIDYDGHLYIGHNGPMKVYYIETGELRTMLDDLLRGVSSIVVSPNEELFFANPGANLVGKIDVSGEDFNQPFSTTVAGTGSAGYSGDGGLASKAHLNLPMGITLDASGNLLIADTNNNVIRMVDMGGIIRTVVGTRFEIESNDFIPYYQATFNTTNGMTFDSFGNLFVTDFDTNQIRKIDTYGYISLVVGSGRTGTGAGGGVVLGDGGHPLDAALNAPRAPVFDSAGNLLFIDESNDGEVVRQVTPGEDGEINGSLDERITTVVGIPGGYWNQHLTIQNNNIPASDAVFMGIRGMDIDSKGNLILADWPANYILKVVPGADGIITGESDEIITIVAGTGTAETTGSGGPAIKAAVQQPNWIAIDANDNIFIREERKFDAMGIIRKIDPVTGVIETVLVTPLASMAFDQSNNLYYSDSTRVFRIDSVTGQRTTIAGIGTGGWSRIPGGFFGDGGDARDAGFQSIYFFTIDSHGDLYLDDSGNYRIRKISFVPLEE